MAFATNSSALGTTTNTQSNSLFGGPKPSGSLFGTPQTTQQQQSTGSLFAQPAQQQQPQPSTGSLFGQQTQQQQQQQQQQPTGLFSQPTQQQSSGNLFGQPAQQQGGGPFNQFGQQQQNTFGGSPFANASTGNQQYGGSTLGSLGNSSNGQQSTGPLGNALQAQATIPAGGFGGGLGGSSIFNNNQQPQLQQSLGISSVNPPSNVPLFSKSTKFNDIPDELKRTLESIDSHIQGRVQISKELHQLKLGDEPTKGQELIRGIHKDLINITTLTRNDLHFTKDMKAKVEQAVQDTIVATRIVDGFRNPQGSGSGYLKDHAGFPFEYFNRVTENMRQRLTWYKSTIEQIERKLSSSTGQTQTPQGISATLQAQHTTFLALASKTAALDAELQKIKTLYTQLWRAKTGSVRDPFNQLDRTTDGGDFAESMAYLQQPQQDIVSGEQYRYALTNFQIAHGKVEQQRIQLEEQERQVAQLRERIALLEGGFTPQRPGNGGNTVDDFSIKNTASQLDKLINRWAADVIRTPPTSLETLVRAILSDVVSGLDVTGVQATSMQTQCYLRHAMAEAISEGVINCLIITNSSDANVQLTRIHEHIFARDPTVASVWRRQTFSAAVETCTPEMSLSILYEQIPELMKHLDGALPTAGGVSVLESAYEFSRMLHGSNSSSGDAFYRAFVPELGSTLYPRQIELVKRCLRNERGELDRVGATVFPGLVKVTRGPQLPDGNYDNIQTVVRRAQVICECAMGGPPVSLPPSTLETYEGPPDHRPSM